MRVMPGEPIEFSLTELAAADLTTSGVIVVGVSKQVMLTVKCEPMLELVMII